MSFNGGYKRNILTREHTFSIQYYEKTDSKNSLEFCSCVYYMEECVNENADVNTCFITAYQTIYYKVKLEVNYIIQ